MSNKTSFKTLNLKAGVPMEIEGGNFFRILECAGSIEVTLKSGSRQVDYIAAAKAGYHVDMVPAVEKQGAPLAFNTVILESSTDKTVSVVASVFKVGFNEFSGSVSFSESMPAAANFAFTVATSGGAGTSYHFTDTNSRKWVLVQADAANTGTVRLTDGTTNYHTLYAGDFLLLPLSGTLKWRFSAAADKIQFIEGFD